MISRKAIYLFLCSTVFIQNQSCSPVPTNRKIRNDVRRRSLDQSDEGLIPSTESTTVQPTVSTKSSIAATDYIYDTKIVKLAELFHDPEQEHAKEKRDTAPRHMVDPGRRTFKPELGGEEMLDVAETHLFRPLFKYQSVDAQRRHIRRQNTSTTTQRSKR